MEDLLYISLLFAIGIVSGVLNVIAGGGSFLTLPLLIFLGLPTLVANGTNRVGILAQSIGAVWGFHRYRVLDWRPAIWAALPASLGAVLGTLFALVVSDEDFKKILAFLMIFLTLCSFWSPLGRKTKSPQRWTRLRLIAFGLVFFLVGIYGGFVQAGVGFLILATTTWAGLDLVRGNALKVVNVLAFTMLSLGIFSWQGKVYWPMGLALAVGTTLGGHLGVRLTVLKGHNWLRGVVTVTVISLAIKLWLAG